MRKLIVGGAALASLVGAGAAYSMSASATPAPTAALSQAERGWCVRSGTGELRNLWLVEDTKRCPDPYWGPVSMGGAKGDTGATGARGPRGADAEKCPDGFTLNMEALVRTRAGTDLEDTPAALCEKDD